MWPSKMFRFEIPGLIDIKYISTVQVNESVLEGLKKTLPVIYLL